MSRVHEDDDESDAEEQRLRDEAAQLEIAKLAIDRLQELAHHPNGFIAIEACRVILDRIMGPVEEANYDDTDTETE